MASFKVPTDYVLAILTGNTWRGSSSWTKQLSSRIKTEGKLGGGTALAMDSATDNEHSPTGGARTILIIPASALVRRVPADS
jgi:hypothetical protein